MELGVRNAEREAGNVECRTKEDELPYHEGPVCVRRTGRHEEHEGIKTKAVAPSPCVETHISGILRMTKHEIASFVRCDWTQVMPAGHAHKEEATMTNDVTEQSVVVSFFGTTEVNLAAI